MEDEPMPPLRKAIIRNRAMRSARLWSLFRSLAGGEEVPSATRELLRRIMSETEEPLDEAVRLAFDVPEEIAQMPGEFLRFITGRVAVCERFATDEGHEIRAFFATFERVAAAFPENPSGRIPLIEIETQTVAEFSFERSSDGIDELWLRVVQRDLLTSEWRDLLEDGT